MSLSERLRPDVEAAPWVIEEVKQLEAKLAKALDGQVVTYMNGYQDGLAMGRTENLTALDPEDNDGTPCW